MSFVLFLSIIGSDVIKHSVCRNCDIFGVKIKMVQIHRIRHLNLFRKVVLSIYPS